MCCDSKMVFCLINSVVHCVWLLLGVFIARGREDALVTKNLVPGESVYGEKRISVEVSAACCIYFYIYFAHIVSQNRDAYRKCR